MKPAGRAVVAVAAVAVAAGLAIADPVGLGDVLAAWTADSPPPETVGGLADLAAEREARIATLESMLAREPLLSGSLFAVGAGLGLAGGGSIAYWRQRAAIRRGDDDA